METNLTIDHIDGNPLNNNLSNLEILNRNVHIKRDCNRNKDLEVNCFYCGNKFNIKGSRLNQRLRADRSSEGVFCSRICSCKYGVEIQNNKRNKSLSPNRLLAVRYKSKLSAQREISEVELLKFGEVLDKFKDKLMMIIPNQASNYLFTDRLEGVETRWEAPKSIDKEKV